MGGTFVARLFSSVAFYGIFPWTSELFPTVLRGQGMALCTVLEKLGMIAVPLVCTFLKSINYSLPFILMGVLALLACFAAINLPETNGKPTRETYDDFFPEQVISNETGCENIAVDIECDAIW